MNKLRKFKTVDGTMETLHPPKEYTDQSDQIHLDYNTFDGDLTKPFCEVNDKLLDKKLKNLQLAESYNRLSTIGYSNDWFLGKSIRCMYCGTDLEFGKNVGTDEWSLFRANFCKDRLCPMCTWRRSLKIFGQVSKIVDAMEDFEFVFATFTIRNVEGHLLADALDRLNYGWKKLIKTKEMRFVKGYFRTIEITRNLNKYSGSYLTYHPHIHVILAVNRSYFKSKYYLTQERLLQLWQRSIMDSTIYYVDIRKISKKIDNKKNVQTYASAVAEVAKYSVSADDYLLSSLGLTDDSVFTLSTALSGRRLATMGGEFRRIHKLLNLDDVTDGDLVNLDDANDMVKDVVIRFKWGFGYYHLVDVLYTS